MLRAIIVSIALVCAVRAYEECQQEYEESSFLDFTPRNLDNIEGSAKPCCLPKQLQGGLWLTTIIKRNRPRDDVDPGFNKDAESADPSQGRGRKPIVIMGEGCYAVDFGKNRLRVNQVGVVPNFKKRFNVTLIHANDIKTMFLIDWQSQKCYARPFVYGLNQCLSANATLLAQPYFGLAGGSSAGLQANIYGEKFATKDACGGALLIVTTNKCVPFVNEYEVRKRDSTTYSKLTYHDEQPTVSDPNTFNPPSFCKKATAEEDFNDEELPHLIQHFMKQTF